MAMKKASFFKPQLGRSEAQELARKHKISAQGKKARKAGQAIVHGEYSKEHLLTIYKWKTRNRGKSRLDWNSAAEIREALCLAASAKEPRTAIAILTGLSGVNVPVASAIMTAMRPNKYTILDFRALEALGSRTKNRSLRSYLCYLEYCTTLSQKWGLPLRDLDHALWDWSKHRKRK